MGNAFPVVRCAGCGNFPEKEKYMETEVFVCKTPDCQYFNEGALVSSEPHNRAKHWNNKQAICKATNTKSVNLNTKSDIPYSIKVIFENGLTTTFNNIASHEEKDGVLHIKYVRDITFPKENIKSIEKLDNREGDL